MVWRVLIYHNSALAQSVPSSFLAYVFPAHTNWICASGESLLPYHKDHFNKHSRLLPKVPELRNACHGLWDTPHQKMDGLSNAVSMHYSNVLWPCSHQACIHITPMQVTLLGTEKHVSSRTWKYISKHKLWVPHLSIINCTNFIILVCAHLTAFLLKWLYFSASQGTTPHFAH